MSGHPVRWLFYIVDTQKKNILEALEKSLGVVTTACREIELQRSTFYKWMKEDEEFSNKVREIQDVAIDTVESALFKRIKEGDTTAMIFYLKTKAKKRGYVERQEVTGVDGAGINVVMKPVYETKEFPLKKVEAS